MQSQPTPNLIQRLKHAWRNATTNRQQKLLAEDKALAITGWTRGLLFRKAGYQPRAWVTNPIFDDYSRSKNKPARPLYHLHLHPFAAYRALGLSHLVDHWVPLVANEGWNILTQDQPYALQRLGTTKQWGHIEHRSFWKEVALLLHKNDHNSQYTQELLRHAGWAGNLVPFEALPSHQIQAYCQSTPTCHPQVALWLVTNGFWGPQHLLPSLGDWNALFPLAGSTFLDWTTNTPVPIAYIGDWIEPLLAHFPLSVEQKISLVGQCLLSFDRIFWEKNLATRCAPYLTDIDMELVYALCNVSMSTEHTTRTKILQLFDIPMRSRGESSLARTVRHCTNYYDLNNGHAQQATPTFKLSDSAARLNTDLLMLVTLQPPKTRIELYQLALMTKNMKKGPMAQEAIALPDLF